MWGCAGMTIHVGLRQNDEQEQATARAEADSSATLRNDKQWGAAE
jgi:hypothetical protein